MVRVACPVITRQRSLTGHSRGNPPTCDSDVGSARWGRRRPPAASFAGLRPSTQRRAFGPFMIIFFKIITGLRPYNCLISKTFSPSGVSSHLLILLRLSVVYPGNRNTTSPIHPKDGTMITNTPATGRIIRMAVSSRTTSTTSPQPDAPTTGDQDPRLLAEYTDLGTRGITFRAVPVPARLCRPRRQPDQLRKAALRAAPSGQADRDRPELSV